MKKIKFIIPFPFDEKGTSLRAAQLPRDLIREGFDVKFVPVKNSCTWADSYYDLLLLDMFIFEEGLKAEEEGYDAVCIDTMSDSGMYALRSRLRIPVIGPGIATMHLAGILGHKFSIITMWDRWIPIYKKNLSEYQLWNKCASIRSISEVPDVENLLTGKETELFKKLEEECLKAIKEDGADVIILGSTTMHQSHKYLSEALPVPVLNPGLIAYKLAEMFLEVGLTQSKTAFPTPQGPKDDMVSRMAAAVSERK